MEISSERLEMARRSVQTAVEVWPDLTWRGFEWRRNPDFAEAQSEMLTEHYLRQFIRAEEWLSYIGCIKSFRDEMNSYRLKHEAERWAGDYIANGMMIAAAVTKGVPIKRLNGSRNALFAISSRNWPVRSASAA